MVLLLLFQISCAFLDKEVLFLELILFVLAQFKIFRFFLFLFL